jgi:hypothetical protein
VALTFPPISRNQSSDSLFSIRKELSVYKVHYAGAVMAFFGMFLYTICLTVMSHKIRDHMYSPKVVLVFRVLALIVCVALGVLSKSCFHFHFCFHVANFFVYDWQVVVFSSIARKKFNGRNALKWLPTDAGFTEHVVSTGSEWALFFVLMIIFVSFTPDFKGIQIYEPFLFDPRIARRKLRFNLKRI